MPLITLIGLPGVGKSTVGRHLARNLGCRFVDSDAEIEKRLGCTIRDFFEREGEAAFREVERKVIAELVSAEGGVLATGGGAVLSEANRQVLRAGSTVVMASASAASIACSTSSPIFSPLPEKNLKPLS